MSGEIEILGRSQPVQALRAAIERLLARLRESQRPPPVLLEGETGTGKGLVARILHQRGPRAAEAFVDVNCAAIPETLLESELFGYERGAFTDARRSKPGLFQIAHRGTIFLDEIALLSEGLQAKLLKVLEERAVRRLGATRSEPVDFWVLAATNADLAVAVREGRFREDLYQRLAVVRLTLPPLRARGDDILLLAEHFLARAAVDHGLPPRVLAEDAREALLRNAWRGNVRELANLMERVALLTEGERVHALALDLGTPAADARPARPGPGPAAERTLDTAMREHVRAVIAETGGNLSRAAQALGITRNTLRAQIRRLELPIRSARGRPRGRTSTPVAPAPPPVPAETARAAAATPAVTIRWETKLVSLLRATLTATEDVTRERGRELESVVDKARSFGGRVDALSTTSVGVVFGLASGENSSRIAVQAGLAMVKALERLRSRPGDPPPVRIVIHTTKLLIGHVGAEIQLDQDGKGAAGAVLDGLLATGAPGTVVVSPITATFLERRFDLRPLGSPPPAAWVVAGPEKRGFDTLSRQTPLVGRAQEIALLAARWRAAQDGQGQLVLLVAEPGMGKSRLVWEFLASEHARDAYVLEVHASPAGQAAACGPFLELFRRYFQIAPEDDDASLRAKVAGKLAALAPGDPDPAPALLAFLGLEPGLPSWSDMTAGERTREIRDALRRLLLVEVESRPVLLLVEDLHSLDATSRELVDAIAQGLAALPLMLLVTSRPPAAHEWGSTGVLTQLSLAPLTRDGARELLDAVLGPHPSLDAVRRRVLERAGGNPFFIEESVSALVAGGVITGAAGEYRLARTALVLPLPPTVEELVATRLSNLPPELRRIVEGAAVLGAETPRSVLAAVLDEPIPAVRELLAALRRFNLAAEVGPSEDPVVRFNHPLLHEITLARMAEDARRGIHQRAYRVLQGRERSLADDTERLARHAFHGGLWAEAVDLLVEAARKTALRASHAEAAAHLEMALVALANLPESRQVTERGIDIRLTMKSSLTEIGAHARLLEHLKTAEAAAAALEDVGRRSRAAAFLSDYHRLVGQREVARRYSEEAYRLARAAGDVRLQVVAGTYLGMVLHSEGDYAGAIDHFRSNVTSLTGDLARERLGTAGLPAIHSRTWLAWSLCEIGEFAEADRLALEATRLAAELPQPVHAAVAAAGLGRVHLRRGHVEAAISVLGEGVDLCRRHGIGLWLPNLASALGLALARGGRHDEGLALLEESVRRAETDSALVGQAQRVTWLGEAYLLAGRHEEAWGAAARAIEAAEKYGQRGNLAWARWLRAEIGRRSAGVEAEAAVEDYGAVLHAAAALGMRPLVALAWRGLAGALARSGRLEEGRRMQGQARSVLATLDMAPPPD
jgi:transcriptional regulator with AAA-type ATPase domain/tetratricopeptide (TPR) repeat protein